MKSIVKSFYNWYSLQIKNPKYRWFIILGTLFYLLSPLDISSDFLPIVGWLDDGVVLTLLTTELSRLIVEKRQGNQKIDNSSDPTIEVKATQA
ncbi:protein of unknown function DUF1232 [Gloeothece citriformis PCC 7424]|uniref:DUF1232 domain-containing protein n=1 Tax=Gloeothece citriformis (strain PCC 7424) TaxID=65393 RepID=B7KA38_GLOC7|nr:YkvA family protein [Gloeothece citriformis]ACK71394.1 protein of unknown function DUF1232 [Gloeothece citriformis PCC 7424]